MEHTVTIVDASAACHMPDVLEMPIVHPFLEHWMRRSGITVRVGGPTCLSGDVIGDYKFSQLPKYGDLLNVLEIWPFIPTLQEQYL